MYCIGTIVMEQGGGGAGVCVGRGQGGRARLSTAFHQLNGGSVERRAAADGPLLCAAGGSLRRAGPDAPPAADFRRAAGRRRAPVSPPPAPVAGPASGIRSTSSNGHHLFHRHQFCRRIGADVLPIGLSVSAGLFLFAMKESSRPRDRVGPSYS